MKGAGYEGGVKGAKIRFIRLEYTGGDWDQDFGVGADLNMLMQYKVLTGQDVHDQTEYARSQNWLIFQSKKVRPLSI